MTSYMRDRLYSSTFLATFAIGHSAVVHEREEMKRTSGGEK